MAVETSFYEIVIILSLAAVIGAVGLRFRQPLIVAFLLVGVIVGPSVLGIVESREKIELMAQIGISLLLFVVGLRLDLHMIRTVGLVAVATGLGQVVFTLGLGFIILLAMGLSWIGAAYVATALTFSSTIIIVKLLSDKKEIDSLHGRIAIGFLIIQDIAAILALIALTALGEGLAEGHSAWLHVLTIFAKGIVFIATIAVLMRYVLPLVLDRLARSHELLVLFAISWAVLLAAVGDYLGFSKEVGAFLAGMSLAFTGYREAIGARLVTLRDFLLLFFFIDLGSRLELSSVGLHLGHVLMLSLFVLIGNPIIVMAIMGYMGYRRRTGFMAGLTVAQISEFSLILGALGVTLGHIGMQEMGLITLVGVVTICASTYLILFSGQLYQYLAPYLAIFERQHAFREMQDCEDISERPVDMILLGLGQYGLALANNLIGRQKIIMAVDFDPQSVAQWRSRGLLGLYGDMGDPELLDQLPIDRVKWVVATTRDRNLSLSVIKLLHEKRFMGKIAVTATHESDAALLRQMGAHVVLKPYSDAAEQGADALTEAMYALPEDVDWPLAVLDVRLTTLSKYVGCQLQDVPLRSSMGVSIVAISRGGKVHFDFDGQFRLYPGDRLVLLGDPEQLGRAKEYLSRPDTVAKQSESDTSFSAAEVMVVEGSPWHGQSLEQLRFGQDHNVIVIGIRRGEERILNPQRDTVICSGDCLIVVGSSEALRHIELGGHPTQSDYRRVE